MPSVFSQVTNELKRLPGIGSKSAERIVFYLLDQDRERSNRLGRLLIDLTKKNSPCKICGLVSEHNPCKVCSSHKRNKKLICVVRNVQDALIIERSKFYNGVYHVLGGLLSVLNNVEEQHLRIGELVDRIVGKEELLFALETGAEADYTIQTIVKRLESSGKKTKVKISKMAVGIPVGTALEYVDEDTLRQSLDGRHSIN